MIIICSIKHAAFFQVIHQHEEQQQREPLQATSNSSSQGTTVKRSITPPKARCDNCRLELYGLDAGQSDNQKDDNDKHQKRTSCSMIITCTMGFYVNIESLSMFFAVYMLRFWSSDFVDLGISWVHRTHHMVLKSHISFKQDIT